MMREPMSWDTLLCAKRQSSSVKKQGDDRNEFQRDYHRIVGSASFRRLQDKTQVFPLDNSDFIRTRLTHSIEVSSFAKSLGQSCFLELLENERGKEGSQRRSNIPNHEQMVEICNILECAGLLHDIGNPPFGHFGEYSIRNWFSAHLKDYSFHGEKLSDVLTEQMKGDLLHFEGNAQALRLLTKLHYLVDENGMHLTYALLNTIIKYPVDSIHINKDSGNIKDKKMGYYYAESELFRDITESTGAVDCRYPLVYLLEAADDIAYSTADVEDGVKKGYVTFEDLVDALNQDKYKAILSGADEQERYEELTGKLRENYKRAVGQGVSNAKVNAVQNWIVSVAQNELLKAARIGFVTNYDDIMAGTYKKELLSEYPVGKALISALKDLAFKKVFQHKDIAKIELSASTMIDFYLNHFVPAVIKYDADEWWDGDQIRKRGDNPDPCLFLDDVEKRYVKLISDNYIRAYQYAARRIDDRNELKQKETPEKTMKKQDINDNGEQGKRGNSQEKLCYERESQVNPEVEKLYLRLLLATDYICGMTDSYARDLYRQLNGIA